MANRITPVTIKGVIPSLTEVSDIVNLQNVEVIEELNNITNVDLIDDITNIQEVNNITSVDTIDSVVDVTNIQEVNNVTNVDLIADITNIQEVNNVTSVDTVDSIVDVTNVQEVNNVSSVDAVDNVTNVNSIQLLDTVIELQNVIQVEKVVHSADPQLNLLIGQYIGLTEINLYARMVTSAGDWSTFVYDGEGIIMPLIPSPGASLAISCDNILDTTTVLRIYYYPTNAAFIVQSQTVTLNGHTKVFLTGTIYRIVGIELDSTSPAPNAQAQVYIYDSTLIPVLGIPASYYDYFQIAPGTIADDTNFANQRETGIYYTPPGFDSYINSCLITATNQSNEGQIAFRIISSTGQISQRIFYIGPGFNQLKATKIKIPEESTLMILGRRLNGTDQYEYSINIDIVQYQLP